MNHRALLLAILSSSLGVGCIAAAGGEPTGETDQLLGTTATPGVAEWSGVLTTPDAHRILATDVGTDASGNVWVAGNESFSTSQGWIFYPVLEKLDAHGTLVFHKTFGATGDTTAHVAVARDGSAYFSASFNTASADLGCAPISGPTFGRAVLVHFAPDGACLGESIPSGGTVEVQDLAATPDGGVVIFGRSGDGQVNFGPGMSHSSPDVWSIYVASLNADFSAKWAHLYGDSRSPNGERPWETANGVGVDDGGNVYIAGNFFGRLTLTSTFDSQLHDRGFLAKLSPSGVMTWSHPYGDRIHSTFFTSLSVGADGHLALGGTFRGTVDFGGSTLTNGTASLDAFVARLDTNGADIWSRRLSGTGNMRNVGVALDGLSNVDVVMDFNQGTVKFGATTFTATNDRILLGKISPKDGTYIWAKTYADSAAIDVYPTTAPVATPNDRIIFGGNLGQSIDFGKGPIYRDGIATGFVVQMFQ